MPSNPPLVFISYAHESPEFREQVHDLAVALRKFGIAVITDHIQEDRTPAQGWPLWMEEQVVDADVVLLVCTEKYNRRFHKKEEPGKGGGVTWEGAIITQYLYNNNMRNVKFFPILPDGGDSANIPLIFHAFYNGHCFPSNIEGIVRLIAAPIIDPNADLPPLHIPEKRSAKPAPAPAQKQVPGRLLGAADNRLQPKQGVVLGREKEVAEVLAFLHSDAEAAVVAALVAGSGGIGKTEVCKAGLKAYLMASPEVPAYYMAFSDRATPEEAVATIGKAMGNDNVANWQELLPLLVPGLYYLDNLEYLAQQAEGVALLHRLKEQPGLRLLASSRVPLPRLAKTIQVEKLPLDAALQLFHNEWAGDKKQVLDNPLLTQFVEKELGCHALSIVLVAVLGDSFSLSQLIKRWKERGTALAKDELEPGRLGSLQTSLHLTSDVLAMHEGALLLWGLVALFPDGMPEEVFQFFAEQNLATDENLQRLVRHNVLTRQADRYDMLPPISRFALDEAIVEQGGFSWLAIRQAAVTWLLPMAELADNTASTVEVLQARFALLAQFPMLHRFLLVETKLEEPDMKLLSRFIRCLRNQYQYRIALGKEMADALHEVFSKGEMNKDLAMISECKGDMEHQLGNYTEARSLFVEAITGYEKVHDGLGFANAQYSLGLLELQLDNHDEARLLYVAAIAGYEKEQDSLGKANVQRSLGNMERLLGNYEEARFLYMAAIAGFEKEQNGLGLAGSYLTLGKLEMKLDDDKTARLEFNKALEGYKKEQSKQGIGMVLEVIGHLELKLEQFTLALAHYDQAILLYLETGEKIGLTNCHAGRVRCYFALKENTKMREAAKAAVAAARASNLDSTVKYVQAVLAEVGLSPEGE